MNDSFPGQRNFPDDTSAFNAVTFLVRMLLGEIATATLVQVVAVHGPTGVSPDYGSVDIQPLVNQIDANGTPTPHGVVHGLPYCRLQGGSSAVVLDPTVGDVGIAVFASRDVSSVKANIAAGNAPEPPIANPGSRRRFDMADGLYIGGVLNVAPSQYVYFLPDGGGIYAVTPGLFYVDARDVFIHASASYSQDVGGYGWRLTDDGGSYTMDEWYTPISPVATDHGYHPPEIPFPPGYSAP